ncbi:MAG: hypothetical protein KUG79_08730 [Pseudomonadales bacterium]|nr:hypothetical protein [Pseudomonadales bacterium]
MSFEQGGLQAVASEHGTSFKNETHQLIEWMDGSPNYDVVFSVDQTGLSTSPIVAFFSKGEKIGSKGVYLDGTSAETYIDSIEYMTRGAHPAALQDFQIALLKISNTLSVNSVTADNVRQKTNQMLAEKLNNMTFTEIVLLGDTLTPDKKTKKIIKDFKQTGTSRDFQHDADIVRLKHIFYLGDLIEKYYAQTGNYPLVPHKKNMRREIKCS